MTKCELCKENYSDYYVSKPFIDSSLEICQYCFKETDTAFKYFADKELKTSVPHTTIHFILNRTLDLIAERYSVIQEIKDLTEEKREMILHMLNLRQELEREKCL